MEENTTRNCGVVKGLSMTQFVNGVYRVGTNVLTSKFEALLHATSTNQKVTYYYYDEIWDFAINNFNYDNVNLLDMYKQRAQQIRDKYSYLVLHFSGGSDSTGVLQAFIDNGIKLDEVYVKWPLKLLNSGIYTPDINNIGATNMLSEWDFSIKPKLDWLRQHHPEIKIVVEDWTDELYQFNANELNDKLFFKHNHNFGLVNFIFSEMLSKSSMEMQAKGVSVAHIYGAEKPLLTYVADTKEFFTYFTDASTTAVGYQHAHGKIDLTNKVDFYLAFEYPQMTIARAYTMAKYLQKNTSMLYLVDLNNRSLPNDERVKRIDGFQKLCSTVLYPKWDTTTFQVEKNDVSNRLYHPWYYYIFDRVEFSDKQKKIETKLKDFSFGINDDHKNMNETGDMVGLKPVSTKFFKLK